MSYLVQAVIASLLLVQISTAYAQTFHYSRGWTNGKRSEQNPMAMPVASSGVMVNPGGNALGNQVQSGLEKLFGNPCELERFRNWLNTNNLRNGPCDLLYDEGRYKRAAA